MKKADWALTLICLVGSAIMIWIFLKADPDFPMQCLTGGIASVFTDCAKP